MTASHPTSSHPAAQTAADLRALAAAGAEALDWDAPAEETIAWVAANFPTREVAVACSMQDAVLPAMVAEQIPGVDVLFLETGYHFAETIGTRDALAHSVDVRVVEALPRLTVAEQDAQYGEKLHDRDPQACCAMRKVEPINRELASYEAWITGVRREDNSLRANTALVEWDEAHQMVKLNPVAAWTTDEVMAYAGLNGVPVNLLLDEGYPSIGCEPCTRPVAPGEDPRAGRWAGHTKTECGLHAAPGQEGTA